MLNQLRAWNIPILGRRYIREPNNGRGVATDPNLNPSSQDELYQQSTALPQPNAPVLNAYHQQPQFSLVRIRDDDILLFSLKKSTNFIPE